MTTYDKIVKLIEQYHNEQTNGDAILFIGAKAISNGTCRAFQLLPGGEEANDLIEDSLYGEDAKDAQIAIVALAAGLCTENKEYFDALCKTVHECKKYANRADIN